ncbi:hypothetical protein K7X08_014662 [Anisodus acutangulus]|uniref:Uncharacterized protein n=1 Tax=Anisodus acutangulus TaxID=402998 RepID=A0A9Q1R3C6_9SOLA|nr:hypothetical protein K7X08_014662 [Anisodus acutangulus]
MQQSLVLFLEHSDCLSKAVLLLYPCCIFGSLCLPLQGRFGCTWVYFYVAFLKYCFYLMWPLTAPSVAGVGWHWRLQLDAPNELLFNVICCFILTICCNIWARQSY